MSGVTLFRVIPGVTWTQPIYVYIYIYIEGWVQIIPGVALILHHSITCYWINILKIQPLNYMFYMFLTCMLIFISIGFYLPFDS